MRQITSKTRFRIHSEHYENVSKCIVQSVYACISSYVWSLIEKVILDLIVRVLDLLTQQLRTKPSKT